MTKAKTISLDELKSIYDELNAVYRCGGSVPVSIFKKELQKRLNLSNDEANELLLSLDRLEILYLQTADYPNDLPKDEREQAIEFEGRVLAYITWQNENIKGKLIEI